MHLYIHIDLRAYNIWMPTIIQAFGNDARRILRITVCRELVLQETHSTIWIRSTRDRLKHDAIACIEQT